LTLFGSAPTHTPWELSRLNIAMEFSARDLEDIQRVAGLLNLTVDELIQQRRASNQTAVSHRHQSLAAHQFPAHEGPQQLSYGLGDRQNEVLPWQHVQASPFELMDVESLDFDEYTDQQQSVGSVTSPVLEEAGARPDVILLNPQAVWYDCDAAMWSLDEGTADNLLPGDDSVPEGDGTESFVAVTPVKMDVDEEMESNPREEGRKKEAESSSGTDWAMVSSSPGSLSPLQTPFSPTAGVVEKRYHPIAPKSGRSTSQSTSQSSSSRVRKKRSPYQGAKKKDTHLTRQVHACVRCRMQRNRVSPGLRILVLFRNRQKAYKIPVCPGPYQSSRPMFDLPAKDGSDEPPPLPSLHGDRQHAVPNEPGLYAVLQGASHGRAPAR